MESYCNGEYPLKDSVNDDLESLFENIRHGREPDEEVRTYFLPKLTEDRWGCRSLKMFCRWKLFMHRLDGRERERGMCRLLLDE